MTPVSETLFAVVTLERMVSAVYPLVLLQPRRVHEGLLAQVALVPLLRVHLLVGPQVPLQIVLAHEGLVALRHRARHVVVQGAVLVLLLVVLAKLFVLEGLVAEPAVEGVACGMDVSLVHD